MAETRIHPSATIDSGAEIGDGSMVWVNVQIREGAKIGKNCVLSKDVYVDCNVSIGDECKIQNSVSIYDGVTIESQVFVGPNASFTNDKVPRAFRLAHKAARRPLIPLQRTAGVTSLGIALLHTLLHPLRLIAKGANLPFR